MLSIDGYNDKLPVLAKVVVEKMKSYVVDEKRFEIVKDQVRFLLFPFQLVGWCTDINLVWCSSRELTSIIVWNNLIITSRSLLATLLRRRFGLTLKDWQQSRVGPHFSFHNEGL